MRRCIPCIAVVLLAACVACGDKYLHTNPYDPAVPVVVDLTGPDTLFSYSERGLYSAVSTPAFPDSAFAYASADSTALAPAGRGTFSSLAPPLYPATRVVRVSALIGQIDTIIDDQDLGCAGACIIKATHTLAWRHAGWKDIVLTQRVAKIRLRCPSDHACDTLSAGATWSVWADGFDALNFPVFSLSGSNANPDVSKTNATFATFIVRDSTIATFTPVGIRVATVTAQTSGATWIVATRGTSLDSLQLVVK